MNDRPIVIILGAKVGQDDTGEIIQTFYKYSWPSRIMPITTTLMFKDELYAFSGTRGLDKETGEIIVLYIRAEAPIVLPEDKVELLPHVSDEERKMINTITGEEMLFPEFGRA